MKVLTIGGAVPYRTHSEAGVTAANIVLYALLDGLVRLGHQVVLQLLFNEYRESVKLSASEEAELQHLAELGVDVLLPIFPGEYRRVGRPSMQLVRVIRAVGRGLGRNVLKHFYPAVCLQERIQERIHENRIDVVLTIWSPEGIGATHGIAGVPRVAYHGDIDFGPAAARMRDRALFSPPQNRRSPGRLLWDSMRERMWLASFKRAHLNLMHGLDVVANVTACNADYYAIEGHTRSVYVGNVWPDPAAETQLAGDPIPSHHLSSRPVKIIGHVGKLGQTGSTYGLRFLLRDLLTELDRVMEGLDYEVHIIGAGTVVPALRPMLGHPRVLLRGFVEDLDSELRSSDMFLLLNNAGSYHAAYTRHLVAWSQGLCLIVHENSRKAIPEIRHMENALVGSTAEEVARMIRVAATDQEANLRVRKGGRATYERYFTPAVVAKTLADEIAWAVSARGRMADRSASG
jgi:hypothetical protein